MSPGALSVAPPPPMPAVMRCSRGGLSTRMALEFGAGLGTYVASIIIPLAFAGAFDGDGRLSPGAQGPVIGTVLLGAFVLSPMSVYWVGQALGGDGSAWGAIVGNLLGGPIGSPIGYELTTAPECPPGVMSERDAQAQGQPQAASGRTPHPRRAAWVPRAPRPAVFFDGVALRF